MIRCAWSDCFVCTFTRGPGPFSGSSTGLGLTGLDALHVAEQRLERREQVAFDLAADADDHPLRVVPAAEVVEERLARRAAHRLLRADDVPAERLVAVEELVVEAADEVARRVEVHVHLLDDHALLAVDLLRLELRAAQHVDENVEGDVPRCSAAHLT